MHKHAERATVLVLEANSHEPMRPSIVPTILVSLALLMAHGCPAEAQTRNVKACLSIKDLNARIDCLEGQTAPPVTSPPSDPSTLDSTRRSPPLRTVPTASFDCNAARSSVERAICGDDELAGWDAQMGQAFQQALRSQKDGQALLESQRRWIILRDRTCGSSAEIPMSCLLEMTKQRASELSAVASSSTSGSPSQAPTSPTSPPASQPLPAPNSGQPLGLTPPTLPPNGSATQSDIRPRVSPSPNVVPALPTPIQQTTPLPSPQTSAPSQTRQSDGTSPLIVLLGIGIGIWLVFKVLADVGKRQRRQSLIAKYGEEDADRIIAGEVWIGMTGDQLIDTLGKPVEISQEVMRTKVKETWKYNQTGKNRFSNRFIVENGAVAGWKT